MTENESEGDRHEEEEESEEEAQITRHSYNRDVLTLLPVSDDGAVETEADSDDTLSDHQTDWDTSESETFSESGSDNGLYINGTLVTAPTRRRVTFPFMDLIPELRRNVYFHALVQEEPSMPLELCPSRFIRISNTCSLVLQTRSWGRRVPQPALLRSNSHIRSEALPLYYRENLFTVENTVLDTGCMYPLYRYPTAHSRLPLKDLRHLQMVLTINQKPSIQGEARSWVTMSICCNISLIHQGTKIRLEVVNGKAKRKQGTKLGKRIIRKNGLVSGYRKWLEQAVESRLGEKDEDGRWDGWSLLRAAALMPVVLKCETNPPWAGDASVENANGQAVQSSWGNLLLGDRLLR